MLSSEALRKQGKATAYRYLNRLGFESVLVGLAVDHLEQFYTPTMGAWPARWAAIQDVAEAQRVLAAERGMGLAS